MSTDQVPLYVGIPLALLCVSASVAVILFVIAIWRGRA